MWLREKSLFESIGEASTAHVNRFIQAIEHPEAEKRFHAVAVVSEELLNEVLEGAPLNAQAEYRLVVISVPALKDTYTAVFGEAVKSLAIASPTEPA